MTWKYCLVECATLFHSRFEQFMQIYSNYNNGVLVKLDNMLFDMKLISTLIKSKLVSLVT